MNFNELWCVLDVGESPGTDRAKRTLDGYDAKHSRQLDQVTNLEKQVFIISCFRIFIHLFE